VASTQVLFINFGQNEALYAIQAISELRDLGIAAELYPDAAKMGKQMAYADKRDIPYVVLAGSDEVIQERYTLKNLKDGKQQSVSLKELITFLS
jgi:histidyl-tRNA synthetase